MTIEEFDKVGWTGGMYVLHSGTTRAIVTVNFIEKLIGLHSDYVLGTDEDGDEVLDVDWVRCENCEIVANLHVN
jgi:hypothetical protein